jgi:hypothetical protein
MERDLCRGYVSCMTCDSVHISLTSTLPLTMNHMRLAAEPFEYLRNVLTRVTLHTGVAQQDATVGRTTCGQRRTLNICGA